MKLTKTHEDRLNIKQEIAELIPQMMTIILPLKMVFWILVLACVLN